MTKFGNTYGKTQRQGSTPIRSTGTTVNHEGTTAYSRDAKSDLFLLGVMNFVSEDTFYESAQTRDDRFARLVHQVTAEDPDWVAQFIPWLRNEANMRSAAVVAACEYVKAGGPNARKVVDSACSRADEPAEVLAYWIGVHGKPIPSSVKRGVADATRRLYNEYSVSKYDGNSKQFRFADVIQLSHAKPRDEKQSALYKYTLDSRYGSVPSTDQLPMLTLRKQINSGEITRDQLLADPELMKKAGMTWESLSGLGQMDAKAWEAVIPNMGYMALLRNLRNFEQAGISAKSRNYVVKYLSDPENVAKSRQLPFRFWSAYKNTSGLGYASAIETALDLSLQNLPAFSGKTLVLTDTSASMSGYGFSRNSTVTPVQAAAMFGVALALKGEDVDLRMFASGHEEFKVQKGGSVLREMDRFVQRVGRVGHGTDIAGALRAYKDHARVVLITDMQTQSYVQGRAGIPVSVPIYGFNLGGYSSTVIGDKNTYEFGGLTDHTFKMIPLLEARQKNTWPWEK